MTDAQTADSPQVHSASCPGTGVFIFLGVLLAVPLFAGFSASAALEPGTSEHRTTMLLLGGVAVVEAALLWWLHRHCTVTLTADARGITPCTRCSSSPPRSPGLR